MSDFYNKYPYTDFHELNLDWVIERVKKLTEDWAATLEEWNSTEEQWQELYDYVHDYFDNLDVQQEINNKINEMIADGTFVTITTPVIEAKVATMVPGEVTTQLPGVVTTQLPGVVADQIGATVAGQIDTAIVAPVDNWLAAHITQPTTPAIDTSLSIAGAAADSKTVGDRAILALGNFANDTQAGTYVDFDNIPLDSVCSFSYVSANQVHKPSNDFTGVVLTLSGGKTINTFNSQIAFYAEYKETSKIAIRNKYSAWGDWFTLAETYTKDEILNLLGFFANDTQAGTYVDFDNLPPGSVASYSYVSANQLHKPSNNFTGTVVTFGGRKSTAQFLGQIAIYATYDNDNRIAYRNKYSAWSEWVFLPLKTYYNNYAFSALKDFVACGDSLTVSLSYKTAGVGAVVKSWANYLAEDCNANVLIEAYGGMNTGDFLNSTYYTDAVADTKDYAILFLGTNDLNDSIDIPTFTQNYSDIIDGLLINHRFVLCISLIDQVSISGRDAYNTAIQSICANNPDAFYVDANKYNEHLTGYTNYGHLSSFGYAALSKIIEMAINDTIKANSTFFNYTIDFE